MSAPAAVDMGAWLSAIDAKVMHDLPDDGIVVEAALDLFRVAVALSDAEMSVGREWGPRCKEELDLHADENGECDDDSCLCLDSLSSTVFDECGRELISMEFLRIEARLDLDTGMDHLLAFNIPGPDAPEWTLREEIRARAARFDRLGCR
jgi:hypothetical protein